MRYPLMMFLDRIEECDACRTEKHGLMLIEIPTHEDLDVSLCRECLIEASALWIRGAEKKEPVKQ